ncbi:TPA: BstXI family restriction endonuclease [Vibrio cholerae]|nr:BstXI family restriction endonuclease [Vibrio cholerae]
MSRISRLPKLPLLLQRKIYKTGQTRGADDDVIYQNRVSRNSTVLIPLELYDLIKLPDNEKAFERGYIVLIKPEDYFNSPNIDTYLKDKGIELGNNAVIFYQLRSDWEKYNPSRFGWTPAKSRETPVGGNYVARIAGTTALDGKSEKISFGFNTKGLKGAGIRLYEYSSENNTNLCRIQLEAIFWMCEDSYMAVTEFGMSKVDALFRKENILAAAERHNLLNIDALYEARIIDHNKRTICPLCLERLSAYSFFNRMQQAIGREVHDLTITEVNLFHINELKYGEYNHKPYNLGWGHHHCNVVVKDSGINETIKWMETVLKNNKRTLDDR